MNQFNAIGRLVRDPETRAIGGGQSVSNVSLAINRNWKDKQSGEWKEETLFIKCTAWGNLADKAATMAKGDLVLVGGHLEGRKWEKDGVTRDTIEVRLSTLESINASKGGAAKSSDDWKNKNKGGKPEQSSKDLNDEIPF